MASRPTPPAGAGRASPRRLRAPRRAVTDPEPNGVDDADRRSGWRRVRGYTATFAVIELGGLVLSLIVGRSEWFYRDEWDFVAGRQAGDVRDLFRPHNEHWTTAPILVY